MAYKSQSYRPNEKSRTILTRAWEHVQSVPYTVTARWLFYRLLQEAFYVSKDDYNNRFLPLLSRARHNFYAGWRPDTLADDSRESIYRGGGHDTPEEWAEAMQERASCRLSMWQGQEQYVEIWFEAQAMRSQFEHYTSHCILRPFSGMPSIPYKWAIAKELENTAYRYDLPLVVLYFGDLDPAGTIIAETSCNDIVGWCDADFQFVRAGLNPGDEVKYNIPENFEHPGAYQWEALADDAARELITSTVAQYVDYKIMASRKNEADGVTVQFREHMTSFRYEARNGEGYE